jgi:hypothetical protein
MDQGGRCTMKADIELILFYLNRMVIDEENILENHKLNLKLIRDCLTKIEKQYNSNIQQIGSNGNGNTSTSREEQW